MRAIHIICRQDGVMLRNLTQLKDRKGTYTSGCWVFSKHDDPTTLIGGWIYLHPVSKKEPSQIGGIILAVSECKREGAATEDGVAFTFEAKAEGRGQPWRGANDMRAWTGGMIEADEPHEAHR